MFRESVFSRGAGYYCLQFQWDQLLPFLHKKGTRVFRDDGLFPGVLIIFNSHVGHEEKLENSSKLRLLPFLSFLFSSYPVHGQLSVCLFAPPLLCGCWSAWQLLAAGGFCENLTLTWLKSFSVFISASPSTATP